MANGTEIDEKVTKRLVCEGQLPPGSLLLWDGEVFMLMGYDFWGWMGDCQDSEVFYDVWLYHVATGITSCFPLRKVLRLSSVLTQEQKQ